GVSGHSYRTGFARSFACRRNRCLSRCGQRPVEMKHLLSLQSARVCNFKALRDSGTVKFSPLTAFIGNNGSGKSSLVEGLEALQDMVLRGIDDAMQPFRGFE